MYHIIFKYIFFFFFFFDLQGSIKRNFSSHTRERRRIFTLQKDALSGKICKEGKRHVLASIQHWGREREKSFYIDTKCILLQLNTLWLHVYCVLYITFATWSDSISFTLFFNTLYLFVWHRDKSKYENIEKKKIFPKKYK